MGAIKYRFEKLVGPKAYFDYIDSETDEFLGSDVSQTMLTKWYQVEESGDAEEKKLWVGWPSKPKKQKSADTVNEEEIETNTAIPRNAPFDLRLAKPRGGYEAAVVPFNADDATPATVGLYPETDKEDPLDDTTMGVPSIHNWYAVTTLAGTGSDKSLLIDTKDKRRWYENDEIILQLGAGNVSNYAKEPSTSSLIAWGRLDKKGRTPYNYSDFAYCKFWNKIPNNRLITLRRYAVPTFASLDFPDEGPPLEPDAKTEPPSRPANNKFLPVAQAVTWASPETGNTLESLLSFSVKMPWKDLQADVHDNSDQQNDASSLPSLFKGFAKSMSILTGEGDGVGSNAPPDPYVHGPYANRIKGPVNRIDTVKRREAGLQFTHSISLQFHYTARSIGGINTKAAMLDILANFLLLTYGTGAFWGGANRYRGGSKAYPWKKGMAAWYSGDPSKFYDAITDSLSSAISTISSIFDSAVSNPVEALKNIASGAVGMAMRQKAGVPQTFQGLRAILTGEPVGEWHLVIGNPYNPLMMIGNLICTDCAFKFSEELGPDDFPTEMTVTVKLEHGMSLDRSGVESLFNKGAGRIYTLPTGFEEKFAANNETRVDKHTGIAGNDYINKVMGVDSTGKITDKKMPVWWNTKSDEKYKSFVESSKKLYNTGQNSSITLAIQSELGYTKAPPVPPTETT